MIQDEKTVLKGSVATDYDRLPPDLSLYEVGDRGKTRYEEKYSAMWEWKPAKAKIPQPAAKHFEPGGKKVIKVSHFTLLGFLFYRLSIHPFIYTSIHLPVEIS